MNSERKDIVIYNEPFCFDAATDCLVHQSVPSFRIPFSHLKDMGDSYFLPFYPHFRNTTYLDGNPYGVLSWRVPPRVELDPEGMAKKYGVRLEVIGRMSDFEVMVNQDEYNLRMLGELPTVRIIDREFIADLRKYELREKSKFKNTGISYHEMNQYRGYDVMSKEPDKVWFPYHPETGTISDILFRKLEVIPSDVLLIELPGEKVLDPVNYARANKEDVKAFLKLNPIQGFYFEAKVIPWEKTSLPEIIRENVNNRVVMTKSNGIAKRIKKSKGI